MVRLTGLHVYPIKSTRGLSLDEAALGDRGLVGDRRFLVVDEAGRFLTQRTLPRLALIAAEPDGAAWRLRAPGLPPLAIPRAPAGGASRLVEVWRDRVEAHAVSPEADAWLTRFLGLPCALVHMPDGSRRQIDRQYAREGELVSFADGYPLLLASTDSLAELGRLGAPVPMSRFRPNLVVSGAAPFAEDGWRAFRIGSLRFRVVKPCARCQVTTIDQDTGEPQGPEPLRALAQHRKVGNEVFFAQNVVHEGVGTLRVGDVVEPEL